MTSSLPSLDLVGDGDEIHAVADVERAFGISLNYSDASEWRTVDDVYDALLRALDHEPVGAWRRFARAIADETGVDPALIGRETELLRAGKPLIGTIKAAANRLFRGLRFA